MTQNPRKRRQRMEHKPVCVKCNVNLIRERSGVEVLDLAGFGPYFLISGDLFRYPGCGLEIIDGFADRGTYHHQESLKTI